MASELDKDIQRISNSQTQAGQMFETRMVERRGQKRPGCMTTGTTGTLRSL